MMTQPRIQIAETMILPIVGYDTIAAAATKAGEGSLRETD